MLQKARQLRLEAFRAPFEVLVMVSWARPPERTLELPGAKFSFWLMRPDGSDLRGAEKSPARQSAGERWRAIPCRRHGGKVGRLFQASRRDAPIFNRDPALKRPGYFHQSLPDFTQLSSRLHLLSSKLTDFLCDFAYPSSRESLHRSRPNLRARSGDL